MDDYYGLLGVEPDARTDDIRAAYREKKAALDARGNETAKVEVARLNKAWNVLSDPYQRGRYDEQRTHAAEEGELEEAEPVTAPPARGGRRDGPRQPRQLPPPTIALPPGTQFAPQRRRLMAMGVDLVVLLALFLGSQLLAQAIAKSTHKHTSDCITALRDAVDTEPTGKKAKIKQTNAKITKAQKVCSGEVKVVGDYNDDNKALTKEQDKLQPIFNTVLGGFFLVGLVYLVIPSAFGGQTFGKRLQRIRVLRQDGTPLRFGDAVVRYGLPILVTYALSFVLGPLGAVVVLVGVTTWMRNPNQQGMHDRVAKTIVVADRE